ncbi:histone deacetylase [Acidobacteriia bacterium AH_259_A11_L15]|nr:histone deacetylase [Acidobacteriia bacterium AH_259_A11_L15]
MLPFKLAYSDGYDLNLGEHVFPAIKYKLIRQKCLEEGLAAPEDFVEPPPAPDEDILRVHTREWVRKLKTGKLSARELLRLEVPYSPQLVRAFWLSAGGSTLASRLALRDACAFNLGGGFHHAYPDHGEGFCAIHDVAVALRRLQAEGPEGSGIRTALVVDLDVHHGNGTAAIFGGDPSVFTLSLHQENNYPYPKPPSDLDVGLADFTGDEEYLRRLREALENAFQKFAKENAMKLGLPEAGALRPATAGSGQASGLEVVEGEAQGSGPPKSGPPNQPEQKKSQSGRGARHSLEKPDLIFYLAGADPYKEDQLGGLALTLEGLKERDRIVIEAAKERGIPIALTFAGGYARKLEDTITIHVNTVRTARDAFLEAETSSV